MNINKFKVGDIITRNAGCKSTAGHIDGSYCGDKIELLGLDEESKIIFCKIHNKIFGNDTEPHTLSYARDPWDENWAYYPVSLYEKAKELIC